MLSMSLPRSNAVSAHPVGEQHCLVVSTQNVQLLTQVVVSTVRCLESAMGAPLCAWLGLCFGAHLQQRPSSSFQGLLCSRINSLLYLR